MLLCTTLGLSEKGAKVMKKYWILLLVSILMITGCGARKVILTLPSNPLVFKESAHEEYDCNIIEYNGKVYLPYCAADVSMCNEVIGYYEINNQEITDLTRAYVLSCKELSYEEWVIDCCGDEGESVSGHNIGMLYREESVKDIPNGLQGQSEYKWNQ